MRAQLTVCNAIFGNPLTAIAPIAGYCPHVSRVVRSVPTLFIVGSDDPLVPIDGGDIRSPWDGRIEHRPPLSHSLARWAKALGLAEQVGEPQLLFPCYDGLATLHLDVGNHRLAETYLAKAQGVCERAGVEPDALMVLPFLY